MKNKDRFRNLTEARNAFRRERMHAVFGYWRGLCSWLYEDVGTTHGTEYIPSKRCMTLYELSLPKENGIR